MNAIGMQKRDPINLGLAPSRLAVYMWTPSWKAVGISRVSTRFSLSVENERADVGRDGRTRPAKSISQARMGTGKT